MLELFLYTLLGLALGSHLGMLIHRVPNKEEILYTPSHCPKCNTNLNWYHNIPFFSWLFLSGKCAFCKEPIPLFYFLAESSGIIIFLIIGILFGTFNLISFIIAYILLLCTGILLNLFKGKSNVDG
jgi:leader peptidase (prepilin peptidase)/N-methyltransferase